MICMPFGSLQASFILKAIQEPLLGHIYLYYDILLPEQFLQEFFSL